MRILLVHNYYGSEAPSGENLVFQAEKALLEEFGHQVWQFTRRSDDIRKLGLRGKILGASTTPWNPASSIQIRKLADKVRPDVVHVHNTFPLISPSIFHALDGVCPRVLTLHNYRSLCPAAVPMRAGQICTECIDRKSVFPAIRHKCYRNSGLATLPLAGCVSLHRWLGTWQSHVDAFIALTDFQRDILAKGGLPSDRMYVKPNYSPERPAIIPWESRQVGAVFVGRLTAEKGVKTLIKAWRIWGKSAPMLTVVGDGEQRKELERAAQGLPVRFTGQLPRLETQREIAKARLLVVPSEWFEGFPLVMVEALASGTPIAVSNIGALPQIVEKTSAGLVFPPKAPQLLYDTIKKSWKQDGQELGHLALNARKAYERYYEKGANYKMLIEIYRSARQTFNEKNSIRKKFH